MNCIRNSSDFNLPDFGYLRFVQIRCCIALIAATILLFMAAKGLTLIA